MNTNMQKPTAAFVGASWMALLVGVSAYLIGLWNTTAMVLAEQGYYFTILMFGLFAAVSLQKAVRDRMEEIPVTGIYLGICWFGMAMSITLLVVGLWNEDGSVSVFEKGFYAMAYLLSMFAAITVQKNVRDLALFPRDEHYEQDEYETAVFNRTAD